MKIAIDVTPLQPDGSSGGVMNLCLNLIAGFQKEPDTQVVLLCTGRNLEFLKHLFGNNVEYVVVAEGSAPQTDLAVPQRIGLFKRLIRNLSHMFPRLYAFAKRVWKRFEGAKTGTVTKKKSGKFNADILFCPFSSPEYKYNGIPVVSTVNDIQHEYYPQFFTAEENAHRTAFYNRIVKNVEAVICISDYTRETFCEKYNYPEQRAHTVYIAIQNRFSGTPNMSILEKLGIRENEYILYPANFWEHKNHKLLLQAFSMYVHQGNSGKLLLTGNTLGKNDEFNALFDALGIRDRVVIAGYVSDEELYGLYKGAKGVIFPSLFEGFGIPVVEAMHIDKLIACSNLTSLPEIGCDAIHFFNPKKPDEVVEGIRYLFENEMTETIRASYQERLKAFSNEKMISAYMDIFKHVAADKEHYVYCDQCMGISADHWSEEKVVIQPSASVGAELELSLQWPGLALPDAVIDVEVPEGQQRIVIRPGETVDFAWKVEDASWYCKLHVHTMWSPEEVLKSEDKRTLGICVLKADLRYADGSVKSLI